MLFWDEPEANINPKYIPVLAELLIMLESEGVQIFVSTHDYFLSKYIEVKRSKESDIQYISLYKDEEKVQCETAPEFELLDHNAIMDTFRQLYREEIGVVLNRYESEEKEQKFEEYYLSITEKFIASLQIYLATILDKFQNTEEVGSNLKTVNKMREIQLKFILVVKNAEDITWLAGPLAELKARLIQIRKIWGVEIAVLNEELAGEYKLTCSRPICGAVTEVYPQC